MVPSRRLREYRHGPAMFDLARSFLPRFPELDSIEFELDLLPSSSRLLGLADGGRRTPRVRIRAARPANPTLTYTIPHELTHLLQRPLRLVPQGERACDLFAMARVGDRFLVAPGYLRVPPPLRRDWGPWAERASELARLAIARRTYGERNYLAWWEAAVRSRFPRADAHGAFLHGLGRTCKESHRQNHGR